LFAPGITGTVGAITVGAQALKAITAAIAPPHRALTRIIHFSPCHGSPGELPAGVPWVVRPVADNVPVAYRLTLDCKSGNLAAS
jgi:hypothetical protein